jgi:hypothetical protein
MEGSKVAEVAKVANVLETAYGFFRVIQREMRVFKKAIAMIAMAKSSRLENGSVSPISEVCQHGASDGDGQASEDAQEVQPGYGALRDGIQKEYPCKNAKRRRDQQQRACTHVAPDNVLGHERLLVKKRMETGRTVKERTKESIVYEKARFRGLLNLKNESLRRPSHLLRPTADRNPVSGFLCLLQA